MDDEEMQEDLTKIQQWIEKNIKSENHQKKMLTENFPPLKTEKTLNQNQRRNKNKHNLNELFFKDAVVFVPNEKIKKWDSNHEEIFAKKKELSELQKIKNLSKMFPYFLVHKLDFILKELDDDYDVTLRFLKEEYSDFYR